LSACAAAQGLTGTWTGSLKVDDATIKWSSNPQQKLVESLFYARIEKVSLVLNLRKDGTFTGTFKNCMPSFTIENRDGHWVQAGRDLRMRSYSKKDKRWAYDVFHVESDPLRLRFAPVSKDPSKPRFVFLLKRQ
jgi:hypothetical protein